MVFNASISSPTTIVAISAVVELPLRPEMMIAVNSGPQFLYHGNPDHGREENPRPIAVELYCRLLKARDHADQKREQGQTIPIDLYPIEKHLFKKDPGGGNPVFSAAPKLPQ